MRQRRWRLEAGRRCGEYDKPIWLTEFACLDGGDTSLAAEQRYMTDALAYLDSEPPGACTE